MTTYRYRGLRPSLAGNQGTDVGCHNLPDSLAQSRAFVVDQGHGIVTCLQTTRKGYGSTHTNYDCNKLGSLCSCTSSHACF